MPQKKPLKKKLTKEDYENIERLMDEKMKNPGNPLMNKKKKKAVQPKRKEKPDPSYLYEGLKKLNENPKDIKEEDVMNLVNNIDMEMSDNSKIGKESSVRSNHKKENDQTFEDKSEQDDEKNNKKTEEDKIEDNETLEDSFD